MGSASAKGIEVVCADLRRVYSLDSEIYDVLGQDFLARLNYLLDYREQKIVLEENGNLRKDLGGAEFPIELNEYRDYVQYDTGQAAQEPVRFMLDSGSRFPVIFENPRINSALHIEREIPTSYSPGSFAGRGVDAGRVRALRIGTETISNPSVRLTRAVENERRLENGLLPTVLFRAIYFNHEKGYVILNPRDIGEIGERPLFPSRKIGASPLSSCCQCLTFVPAHLMYVLSFLERPWLAAFCRSRVGTFRQSYFGVCSRPSLS